MGLTHEERSALAGLGVFACLALALLAWQHHRAALRIEPPPPAAQTATWDAALADAQTVDLNTADSAELERLPGVGHVLAGRILDYRVAHGPFHSIDELRDIAGIGPRLSESLRHRVVIRPVREPVHG